MRSLIVDSSVWVDWLRGKSQDTRELARERVLIMPAVVAMELLSGARERRVSRSMHQLISSFERHRRLFSPTLEDFLLAGETLADLGWSASHKANDALIIATARRIGAEVLTRDLSDMGPLAKGMSVRLVR